MDSGFPCRNFSPLNAAEGRGGPRTARWGHIISAGRLALFSSDCFNLLITSSEFLGNIGNAAELSRGSSWFASVCCSKNSTCSNQGNCKLTLLLLTRLALNHKMFLFYFGLRVMFATASIYFLFSVHLPRRLFLRDVPPHGHGALSPLEEHLIGLLPPRVVKPGGLEALAQKTD